MFFPFYLLCDFSLFPKLNFSLNFYREIGYIHYIQTIMASNSNNQRSSENVSFGSSGSSQFGSLSPIPLATSPSPPHSPQSPIKDETQFDFKLTNEMRNYYICRASMPCIYHTSPIQLFDIVPWNILEPSSIPWSWDLETNGENKIQLIFAGDFTCNSA